MVSPKFRCPQMECQSRKRIVHRTKRDPSDGSPVDGDPADDSVLPKAVPAPSHNKALRFLAILNFFMAGRCV